MGWYLQNRGSVNYKRAGDLVNYVDYPNIEDNQNVNQQIFQEVGRI